MKALILNSGMGTRMGDLTENGPKCLVELEDGTTILDRQLSILKKRIVRNHQLHIFHS